MDDTMDDGRAQTDWMQDILSRVEDTLPPAYVKALTAQAGQQAIGQMQQERAERGEPPVVVELNTPEYNELLRRTTFLRHNACAAVFAVQCLTTPAELCTADEQLRRQFLAAERGDHFRAARAQLERWFPPRRSPLPDHIRLAMRQQPGLVEPYAVLLVLYHGAVETTLETTLDARCWPQPTADAVSTCWERLLVSFPRGTCPVQLTLPPADVTGGYAEQGRTLQLERMKRTYDLMARCQTAEPTQLPPASDDAHTLALIGYMYTVPALAAQAAAAAEHLKLRLLARGILEARAAAAAAQ